MRGRSPRGCPALARRRERVQHGAVGARRRSRGRRDRGPRRRSARRGRAAPRRSAAPRRARRRRTARASQAVREPSVPSANALTGPMRSQSSPRPLRSAERDDRVEPLGRERGPDAQREPAVGVQPLPGREAVLALEVVDPGDPARVRLAHPVREGRVELVLARRAGSPRRRPRPRSRAGRRSARRTHRARRRARCRSAAARAPPTRARPCGGRAPRAAPRARRRPRPGPRGAARDRRPASARSASPRRSPSRRRSARAAAAAASTSACERVSARSSRPSESDHSRKCTWASVKPGTTQRPSRSTRSLETSERSPSRTSTPPPTRSPASASARASGSLGVAGADAAVVEDHAAEGSPCAAIVCVRARRPRLRPRRSIAASRRSRPGWRGTASTRR